jgi:cytochrome c5
VPAPSATPTPATAEAASAHAKATYQELCTGCHDASVIETQGYSRAQWDETVHSMVDRGLTSTPEQLDEIIGYLAKNFPPQGSQK